MSTSPEQAPHEAALFRTIREWGITRGDNGVVGGVVEGLGDRIGMARVPARIIVFVAAFPLTVLVLLGYAAAWALLPDRKGNIILQNFGRGVPNVGALIGIAVLALFGLGSFDRGNGFALNNVPWYDITNWSGGHVIVLIFAIVVPMLIIGGVVAVIVAVVKRSGSSGSAPASAPIYAVPPAGTSATPAGFTNTPPAAAWAHSVPPTAPVAGAPLLATPPARHWAPAPPAPPTQPRRPRVPGPGRGFYLLTLALAAISAATAAWLEREDRLAVHPLVAGLVIFFTGLGVILVLVSLAGRKLGFLGFVGIASLVPMLVFAGNADSLRTAYADHGGITSNDFADVEFNFDPTPAASTAFDPTLAFDGLYSDVLFNGSCYESTWENYGSSSVQRLDLATAPVATAEGSTAPETTIDITAEVTYLSVSKGANLVLTGSANAMATVVFADRGFICDFQPSDTEYMRLGNSTGPTINLVVSDDRFANTIVIKEEVAS